MKRAVKIVGVIFALLMVGVAGGFLFLLYSGPANDNPGVQLSFGQMKHLPVFIKGTSQDVPAKSRPQENPLPSTISHKFLHVNSQRNKTWARSKSVDKIKKASYE